MDPHYFLMLDPAPAFKSTFRSFRGSKKSRRRPWTLLEAWMVCRPVVADSHHFDENPDPDECEKLDPDPDPTPWKEN